MVNAKKSRIQVMMGWDRPCTQCLRLCPRAIPQAPGCKLPQRAYFSIHPPSRQCFIAIHPSSRQLIITTLWVNFPADIFPVKLVNKILSRWTAWSNPSSTLQSTEDFKKISFARCSSALVVKLMMWQKSQNWQFDRPHHLSILISALADISGQCV